MIDVVPTTVGALIKAIEQRFFCMVGPPMAYFELPFSECPARAVYDCYRLTGSSEAAVVARAWEICLALIGNRDDRPVLFWRYETKIIVEPVKKQHRLRMRICVPGGTSNQAHTIEETIP